MGPDGLSQVSVPTQNEGCRMEGFLMDVEERSVSMLTGGKILLHASIKNI